MRNISHKIPKNNNNIKVNFLQIVISKKTFCMLYEAPLCAVVCYFKVYPYYTHLLEAARWNTKSAGEHIHLTFAVDLTKIKLFRRIFNNVLTAQSCTLTISLNSYQNDAIHLLDFRRFSYKHIYLRGATFFLYHHHLHQHYWLRFCFLIRFQVNA